MKGQKHERFTTYEELDFYARLASNTNVFIVRTFKQSYLTWEKVSLSNSHFIHRANRYFFGNNYRRKNKSIGCVSFIEKKGHLHSNLLIKIPNQYTTCLSILKNSLRDCHIKSRYSDRIIHITIHDNNIKRMVNYSNKEQIRDRYMVSLPNGNIVYKPEWSTDLSYDAFDDKNTVIVDDDCNLIQQTSTH